jgi:hypothetical protein
MVTGGCRCGAVRYEAEVTQPDRHGLCHCEDCRRSNGAPAVAWLAVPEETFRITRGEPTLWQGTGGALRFFCGTCGTGLYYLNREVIPGIADIQTGTLDDPNAFAPAAQIQVAERLTWVKQMGDLPEFDRYPSGL